MQELVENQCAVNVRNYDGCTPLHFAALEGQLLAARSFHP